MLRSDLPHDDKCRDGGTDHLHISCETIKPATEAYDMLKDVYRHANLSRIEVFEFFKMFKDGRERTEEDNAALDNPASSKTDASTLKIVHLYSVLNDISTLRVSMSFVNGD